VQQKFELKLSPPLKSVVTLPCKMYKWSSIQLYIHISENSTLYVRRYLFYEFYFFIYFFFLIMTSLWHDCNVLFHAFLRTQPCKFRTPHTLKLKSNVSGCGHFPASLFIAIVQSKGSWVISLTVFGASVTNLNEPPHCRSLNRKSYVAM